MSFGWWLVIIGAIIVIVAIIAGVWWYNHNRNEIPIPATITGESAPLGWSTPTQSNNKNKNVCQVYEFPTQMINQEIDGRTIYQYLPPNPTLNTKILNGMSGNTGLPSCLDSDQILAQQVVHQCIAPVDVINGQISRCILQNGGTTGLNGTEIFYTNASYSSSNQIGCPNIPVCPGQLGLISINYQMPVILPYCITSQGVNQPVTMMSCDPTNELQVFRITRINPGENPNNVQPGQATNGIIGQIYDRKTGKCVVSGKNKNAVTVYIPASVGNPGCTGNDIGIIGTDIVLGDCTGGVYPGYVWAFIPSLNTCIKLTTGQCIPVVTPPQIGYIGDYDLTNIPTTYKGYTGIEASFWWLVDNGMQSMYYGGYNPTAGETGYSLITTAIAQNIEVCESLPATSQYINLNIYNSIIEQAVCYQQTGNDAPCVKF